MNKYAHAVRRISRIRASMSRLRRRGADEQGTVILIVAVLMTAMLGFGAYTIDIGSGRANETRTQAAADASAEAAASYIGQQMQSGTTPTSASVNTYAAQIAQQNGFSNAVVTWPYGDSNHVRVLVSGTTDTSLGQVAGRSSTPVSAAAIAAVSQATTTSTATVTTTVVNGTTSTYTITNSHTATGTTTGLTTGTTTSTSTDNTCAGAGGNCLAVFAAATTCSSDANSSSDPVVMGGGVNVSGGVWSNGSINLGGGGSTFGALTYKSGCTISPVGSSSPSAYKQNSNTFNNGYPTPASPLTTWPLDYAQDFPACSNSGSVKCTGPSGTPSYCTKASTASSWSIDTYTAPYTLVTGQIYWGAVGSGTASTPTSWNGALTVSGGSSSLRSSFIAGSITVGGGSTLAACGYNLPKFSASTCTVAAPTATPNYPLFYAVSGDMNESSGGNGLTGDWFVPNGGITVGGGTSFIGFLEAQTVNLSSGGIQGDGPADSGSSVGATVTNTTTTTATTTRTTTSTSTDYTTTSTVVNTTSTGTSLSTTTSTGPNGRSDLTG